MLPVFVDRKTCAYLMSVSVETFDAIRNGRSRFPAPAYVEIGQPFWRWSDVEQHLAGSSQPVEDAEIVSPFQKALEHEKGARRART